MVALAPTADPGFNGALPRTLRVVAVLLGLLVPACVGSPPPPPSPAATDAATDGATVGDAAGTTSATSTGELGQEATTLADGTSAVESTTGAIGCDPPCQAGQECIDGACLDMPDATTAEPPAECGLAVEFDYPDFPECGPCAKASCCLELQACFGDEVTMMETECHQLNNCIAMSCSMVMTTRELQACAEQLCPTVSAWFDTWLAFEVCLAASCQAACT